jgi:SAM-dependent methyltransferase
VAVRRAERFGIGGRFCLKTRHRGRHVLMRNDRPAVTLRCPACSRATPHRLLYVKNGCDILQCPDCGLGRTETSSFDPLAYYDDGYFSGRQSDGYADYRGAEPVLRREFARTVAFIQRHKPKGRLLEIGCAYGFFLDEARRAGFEVSGIEPAEAAAAHAGDLGLSVTCGLLGDATLKSFGALDVIVLLDVIEHLPDPQQALALLAEHLRPNGIIVLTTGDFGSLAARTTGAHWRLMTPPQHLWFFNRESIASLAGSVGLRVESLDHPWKFVALSLIAFQAGRMLGRKIAAGPAGNRFAVPVNLFDAMRVVLSKVPPSPEASLS